MKRALAASVAWVVACGAFLLLILQLDLDLNFFSWNPRWKGSVAAELAGIAGAALVLGLVARARWNRVVRVVAGIVSLAVLAVGFYAALPEPLGTNWLDRTAPSPWWYRGGRVVVTAIPLLLWIGMLVRARAESAGSHSAPADSA